MSESISPKPPKPTAQYIMESVVDLVAIVALSFLTWAGKVPQWPAIVVIALLAGVRISDLGNINRPGGGPGGTEWRRRRGRTGGLADRVAVRRHSGLASARRSRATRVPGSCRGIDRPGVAACSAGCYHRDGRAFTGPEYAAAANQVWKFTLAAAHAACDVIDSPAGDAASVMIQGAAVPIAVARGACGLYNAADPRAVGVLVHSDGTGHVMGGAS
jgi:hypothetical protein